MTRTAIDRGGTFVDVVHLDEAGRLHIQKLRSDTTTAGALAMGATSYGTTVATNALLEGERVPTLLIVTEGFEDLPWIRDMTRPDLFDADATRPAPLCARVHGLRGRIDADGQEIVPLDVGSLPLDDVEAVAVALVNAHASPQHELAVAEAIAAAAPHLHVSLGHRVCPELGYLSRLETTLVDAAITPILRRALARDALPPGAMTVRSDGSLCPAEDLRAADAVLSGPASAVLAVEHILRESGFEHGIGLDMGGTSTDVCVVQRGRPPRRVDDARIGGARVRRPMLDIHTVAAGGGSIVEDGLLPRVGPRSAGADPGPACYGRGGPLTVTDAALALGRVDPTSFTPPLTATPFAGDPATFLAIAQEQMAGAVEAILARRGVRAEACALVVAGGAAGQHAAEVAERLGIDTVLVHPCAPVLCAFGQLLARREERRVAAIWLPFPACLPDALARAATLRRELPDWPDAQIQLELRPAGTDARIDCTGTPDTPDAEWLRQFREAHVEIYGVPPEGPPELVNVHVLVRAAAPPVPTLDADPFSIGANDIDGPVTLFSATTAVYVPERWRAQRRGSTLRVTRVDRSHTRPPTHVATWARRLMAAAEEAGGALERLARSVNIRDRRDYSCAVFNGDGLLIANAPHIPVHLGAMGETVRDLIRHEPDLPHGSAWLTNDPAAGGSHLPDLTVVTPIDHDGARFFVANRGHHVDVGGLTPGSMPPHARRLSEEGLVIRRLRLTTADGDFDAATVRAAVSASRQPDVVIADLRAQVAANHHLLRRLTRVADGRSLSQAMAALLDATELAFGERLAGRSGSAADVIDGIPIRVTLRSEPEHLVVDFTGTRGPHPGNLNAPPAVTRAAVLYALRVLVGDDLPLNEGALRRVRIVVPPSSILSAPAGVAVAGGNVETSQRVVDLILRAAGARAGSQGTMNNLTVGGAGWSAYETLGGGGGARDGAVGPSAVQIHMTNTRVTDVEVLERRLPMRVVRFARRPGSGGSGRFPGGDGLVRELELLQPGEASLLATRRQDGAPGLAGGGSGAPGRDALRRAGCWTQWDGTPTRLDAGDRVRVETPGGGGFGAVD